MKKKIFLHLSAIWMGILSHTAFVFADPSNTKSRVIITTDGEIDDECSLVRFLLYTNEWDVEGIITSSSQYHWQGHKWAGDDWIKPSLKAYSEVYPNLIQHDSRYPSPAYLKSKTFLGNVATEGEMEAVTKGSEHIVKVLLDESDPRPVWLQAWGGTNTIARALKTIEETHPEKMEYVARKVRFFFIWEQDTTYQSYIRPHWAKYNILTIISDQFEAIAYRWKQAQPQEMQPFFEGKWMKQNILQNHGPLCAGYKAHSSGEKDFDEGDFRSEGDSPAFMHTISTGLRNLEHPDWGGWGGRYVKIRENTWLDPVPDPQYQYPEGRWYGSNGWGRSSLRESSPATEEQRKVYSKPIWQWSDEFQNDFAARADWCVKTLKEANHPPIVTLNHALDFEKKAGEKVKLAAKATDPDGNKLQYKWWHYTDAGSYKGVVTITDSESPSASFTVPKETQKGDTIHLICEVKDNGTPQLTRYQRVVVSVK
jgi:hypothetical protein